MTFYIQKKKFPGLKEKESITRNTHGTGCTLSSAIAANLAKGFDLKTSVQRAKDYISRALADMLDLGTGSGPMNHAFDLKDEWKRRGINKWEIEEHQFLKTD